MSGNGWGAWGKEDGGLEDLFGEFILGHPRERHGAVGVHQQDLVAIGIEADVGARDIVGDHQVAALAGELGAGVGFEVGGFGGEADQGAVEAELGAGAAEDVGVADEFEREGPGILLDFARRDLSGPVIGYGGGEDRDVGCGEVKLDGLEHFSGGFDRQEIDPRGNVEVGGAGDEQDAVFEAGGGGGEGVAHFARRAVRQVADRVERFAGGAGGDEEFQHEGGELDSVRLRMEPGRVEGKGRRRERVKIRDLARAGNWRLARGVGAGKHPRVSDKLAEIIATKRTEVEQLLPRAAHLRAAAYQRNEFRGFRAALDRGPGRLGVIAEVKKASPSAGVIDPGFDPFRQARRYMDGGASCLSILTDEKYFQGSLTYLAKTAEFSTVPLLRKDFTIHPVQVHEAVVAGADAVLLIVAALDDDTLRQLHEEARACQLDVLVEVHDLAEMDRALELGADLIGVNNRNLKTFATDLATTERLADEVPDDVLLVSESGIKTTADAARVLAAGANAVLIGESLMRAEDPGAAIAEYLALGGEGSASP